MDRQLRLRVVIIHSLNIILIDLEVSDIEMFYAGSETSRLQPLDQAINLHSDTYGREVENKYIQIQSLGHKASS